MNESHRREACDLQYPNGEGYLSARRLTAETGLQTQAIVVHPDSMISGWHRFRIQVFSDGTCGFALDGKPIWRSTARIPLDVDYRILLAGKSAGTKMIAGPLALWQGVKLDVDWFAIPK
jgi:hypothetical protein